MSLQTYIQAAPVRAMNDGETVITDASEYLDMYDIGLVHAETPTSLFLHIRVLATAAHGAKLLHRMPLTIRLPGQDYDASLLMWPPFRHPAKPSRGPHSTTSLYDRHPAAVAVVVWADLSRAASRHHRFHALDRKRSSGAAGEVALKDTEEDVLAFIQEGSGLAAGAVPARVVSELQLIPPNDVSDSLTKAHLSVMVFDDLFDLPVVLPILRRGTERSRLWASVTPRAKACPEATIRAAILHAHDDTRVAPLYIAGMSSKAFGAPLQTPAVANSLPAASRRDQLSTTTTVRITHRTHMSSFRTSNFLSPTGRRPKWRGRPGRPMPVAVRLPPASHTPQTSMPQSRSVPPAHLGKSAPPSSHHDAPPHAATITHNT